ncbi:hypothetical protein GUJ93_ZPchr0012g22205 [Zizania palustris]|uniref:Uncharacterized protein n=1 Tax=Zizania palustris TaxID=103762 RepID=A0A8J6BP22_ZIZPA|nr:hypothetical protein GUJ93_ZPchr0012g22205 [Zizania palustris]
MATGTIPGGEGSPSPLDKNSSFPVPVPGFGDRFSPSPIPVGDSEAVSFACFLLQASSRKRSEDARTCKDSSPSHLHLRHEQEACCLRCFPRPQSLRNPPPPFSGEQNPYLSSATADRRLMESKIAF